MNGKGQEEAMNLVEELNLIAEIEPEHDLVDIVLALLVLGIKQYWYRQFQFSKN